MSNRSLRLYPTTSAARGLPAIDAPRRRHDTVILGGPLQCDREVLQHVAVPLKRAVHDRNGRQRAGSCSPVYREHATKRLASQSIPTSDQSSTWSIGFFVGSVSRSKRTAAQRLP